jgi:mono/diheme cytochrome c family protein
MDLRPAAGLTREVALQSPAGVLRPSSMQRAFTGILLLASMAAPAQAGDPTPDQVRKGAEIYAVNCSPCHGPHMQGSESAFDLRKFPPDQHDRFLNSVTRGKNQMPPWGDAFSMDQLEALWAYVTAGER